MEQKLNTISKSSAKNFNNIQADFSMQVDFEPSTEQFGDDVLELNKISIDEVEFLKTRTRKNGVEGIECELLINHSIDVNFELDTDGSLNVSDFNVEKYSVNNMGELILQL